MRRGLLMTMIVVLTLLPRAAVAGDPNTPPGPPASGSSMPTLQELYDYLMAGTQPDAAGAFKEPDTGPGTTMKTLKEIYEAFKSLIVQCTVTPEKVLSGQKFFSTAGTWGPADGMMPDNGAVTITPGTTNQPIAAGYHNGAGNVIGDADLVAANVKQGVTIFGVTGTYEGKYACNGTLSNGGRWCTNGDGTVTDTTTGLTWLADAGCLNTWVWVWWSASWHCEEVGWFEAEDRTFNLASGQCGLTDGSWKGVWRLPTVNELYTLAHGSEQVRLNSPGPFHRVQPHYWSNVFFARPDSAWFVSLEHEYSGVSDRPTMQNTSSVWPVRSEQYVPRWLLFSGNDPLTMSF